MHWRQVDVVCERASGIPCVSVVLLEGVGCMPVGKGWIINVIATVAGFFSKS